MNILQVSHFVNVETEKAFSYFWNVEQMPKFWKAITKVEASYDDGFNQECLMSVIRNGKPENIRIIRFRSEDDILFFNPQPPPMMTFHRGAWRFQSQPNGGCLVIADREYQLKRQNNETDRAYNRRTEDFQTSFQTRLDNLLLSFKQYCHRNA